MARLMILLVVVAVSVSAALSCPPDEAAMVSEMAACTAGIPSASQTMGKEAICLTLTTLLRCVDTVLTGCEGVPYVEAERGSIDAGLENLNRMHEKMMCT